MYHQQMRGVDIGCGQLAELAAQPHFLESKTPHAAFSPPVDEIVQGGMTNGYSTNPLDPQLPIHHSPNRLKDKLDKVVEAQYPDSADAKEAAAIIVDRANRAGQVASLPPLVRIIGGLAAYGLGDQWTDEAIAAVPVRPDGLRKLSYSTYGNKGYTATMLVRELSPEDFSDSEEYSLDPALLVRTRRFGAVAADFYTANFGSVGFSVDKRYTNRQSLTLETADPWGGNPIGFEYANGNLIPPYNDNTIRHQEKGRALTTIRKAAEQLLANSGSEEVVRKIIQDMINHRYTVPPDYATDQSDHRAGLLFRLFRRREAARDHN